MPGRYWLETLGCPKNQVDSDKLAGALVADGYVAAGDLAEADLVVVNTCAFIEAARQESVDTILALAEARAPGARLVVTGCLAERYGDELATALPEVDLVAGFGQPLLVGTDHRTTGTATGGLPERAPDLPGRAPAGAGSGTGPSSEPDRPGARRRAALAVQPTPAFDLLELPRPPTTAPWAYVKVAEGCDRRCGFCAIPSFRGAQRSRSTGSILAEVEALGPSVAEVVLVAQDLASWGLDRQGDQPAVAPGAGRRGDHRPLVGLIRQLTQRVERVRLLYLYPSSLDDALVEAVLDSGVPYFDLSLQHVSAPLVKAMRRWGDGRRFLDRIRAIRAAAPEASLRSSFILGYPGETEEDHDQLLEFLTEARLDWAGFFTFSPEPGTYAMGLDAAVPAELAMERLRECAELQDAITEEKRRDLVGRQVEVLVDTPGNARSWREAPEIDGVVRVPHDLPVGQMHQVAVTAAVGPDVWAEPVR